MSSKLWAGQVGESRGNLSEATRRGRHIFVFSGLVVVVFVMLVASLSPSVEAARGSFNTVCYKNPAYAYNYGVKATFNVVKPVYSHTIIDGHGSLVGFYVNVLFPDGGWIQLGYFVGWVKVLGPGGLYWREYTNPTAYEERMTGSGVHSLNVRSPLVVGSSHTFSIQYHATTNPYQWYSLIDGVPMEWYHILPYSTTPEISVQGECKDTTDHPSGVVHFTQLKQLKVYYFKGGWYSTWYDWNGNNGIIRDNPWSYSIPNGNAFDAWTP